MHLINWWPHSAAWKWRILGKTEHFVFLLLLGPVALRLNGLLKKRHTLQTLFSCSFPLSIVSLYCFNQVHCRIIWRRGGAVPLSFSGRCLLNCSSVWPVRAAFQQHHRQPPHPISLHFSNSRHSVLLSLVYFWQSFMLAAICSASLFYYQHHASHASISFIHLTNAPGKPSLSIKHTLKVCLYTVAPAALSL